MITAAIVIATWLAVNATLLAVALWRAYLKLQQEQRSRWEVFTGTTVPANNSLSRVAPKKHPGQRWPWLTSCVQVPETVFDRPPRHCHLLSGKS
jgi:hypothetical protein